MIGIVSGLKVYLVLAAVLAVAGTLAYLTHTLTSGAAAEARLESFAEASAATHDALQRTQRNFAFSQREVEAARGELDVARADAARRKLDRTPQGTEPPGVCNPGCRWPE